MVDQEAAALVTPAISSSGSTTTSQVLLAPGSPTRQCGVARRRVRDDHPERYAATMGCLRTWERRFNFCGAIVEQLLGIYRSPSSIPSMYRAATSKRRRPTVLLPTPHILVEGCSAPFGEAAGQDPVVGDEGPPAHVGVVEEAVVLLEGNGALDDGALVR